MRSIYDNPYKYAHVCSVPYELAKIACLKQRHSEKERRKNKPCCPECGLKQLSYEMGSYEEGYDDYVECCNCGQTFNPDEIPNVEYLSVMWDDFDAILYYSVTNDKKSGWIEACGAETLEDWQAFAKKEILGKNY